MNIFILSAILILLSACAENTNQVVVENKGIFNYAANASSATPRFIKAKEGDSLWLIAKRYGFNVSELANYNNISPPYNIRVNQKINIPSTDKTVESKPVATPIKVSSKAEVEQPKNINKKPEAIPKSTQANAPVKQGDFKYAHPLNNSKFVWPVSGKVLKRYTRSKKGESHEGISIAAALGTAIKATNDGEVVYVGDDLKKYGNLIIIKHRSNFMSAYAHTQNVKVKLGQTIKRGQHIANVGKSGKVNSPRLFFSLQRNEKVIDPEQTLR